MDPYAGALIFWKDRTFLEGQALTCNINYGSMYLTLKRETS